MKQQIINLLENMDSILIQSNSEQQAVNRILEELQSLVELDLPITNVTLYQIRTALATYVSAVEEAEEVLLQLLFNALGELND